MNGQIMLCAVMQWTETHTQQCLENKEDTNSSLDLGRKAFTSSHRNGDLTLKRKANTCSREAPLSSQEAGCLRRKHILPARWRLFKDLWGKQQQLLHRRGSCRGFCLALCLLCCCDGCICVCQDHDETGWWSSVSVCPGTLEVITEWWPCDLSPGVWAPSACSAVAHGSGWSERASEGSRHHFKQRYGV